MDLVARRDMSIRRVTIQTHQNNKPRWALPTGEAEHDLPTARKGERHAVDTRNNAAGRKEFHASVRGVVTSVARPDRKPIGDRRRQGGGRP